MREGLNIFRQAEATEAESGFQELLANARIESDGARDFLDVASEALAQIREDVGIGNFQAQERIRGVLDQFGAGDGGDQKFRLRSRRAFSGMNRARKPAFENGSVKFAKLFA